MNARSTDYEADALTIAPVKNIVSVDHIFHTTMEKNSNGVKTGKQSNQEMEPLQSIPQSESNLF